MEHLLITENMLEYVQINRNLNMPQALNMPKNSEYGKILNMATFSNFERYTGF